MSFKPTRCRLALAVLLASVALPARADNEASASGAQPAAAEPEPDVIVIAPPLFRDVRPERTLDDASIASYGVSTVDELVGEILSELDSDEEPVFIVNGERVYDLDEIGAYPVEILRQMQVLPRGSATRLGGRAGQRVISMSLRRQVRTATVAAAPRIATEGDWVGRRGETIFTVVRGPTRGNLSLRVRDEDAILESERGIIQPPQRLPFATTGNVVSHLLAMDEIDPLLSDAAGTTVTVAPIPAKSNPTIADFASSANRPAEADIGDFRSLRPHSRNYDLNGSFSTRLSPWLRSSATLRLSRGLSRSDRGLASAVFVLGADNAFSPFSRTVDLALYRDSDPLRYRSTRDRAEGNVTFNAGLGKWQVSLNAKHIRTSDRSVSDRQGSSPIPLADTFNPFAANLGDLIPITRDRATSNSRISATQLTVTGSPLKVPAGDLHTTLDGRLEWSNLRSRSSFSETGESRRFNRSLQAVRAGVELPIASRRNDFLGELGELSATADVGRVHLSDAGLVKNHSVGLTWEPRPALRLRGAIEHTGTPPAIDILGDPVVVIPDYRVLDVVTGETVDVIAVTGGNPLLLPESTRTHRLSAILRLVPRLGLQLSGEYSNSDQRNFVSGLPTASPAIVAAFPDRFIRDATGRLIRVDLRPVNFASHQQKRLRYGLSLNAPIGGGGIGRVQPVTSAAAPDASDDTAERDDAPAPAARRGTPPTRLQLTANHTIVLHDEILIRPGLDPVDLLEGGAFGIGGGRVRHQIDGTAAITSGGTGARLGVNWRGGNVLETRVGDNPGLLRFSPLLVVNLRTFADAQRFFPNVAWASKTRISLNVLNITGERQRVRDQFGETPLQYQPGYRDPLGRTVEFEIRKVF